MTLSADAYGIYEKFSAEVEQMLGPDGRMSSFADWGGKLAGTSLRIAGLMSLVENGPDVLVIEEGYMKNAVELCRLLIGHAEVAFGIIGMDEALNGAKKLFKWIQDQDYESFTRNGLHRGTHGLFNKSEMLDKPLNFIKPSPTETFKGSLVVFPLDSFASTFFR
jgi:hypothetical protein